MAEAKLNPVFEGLSRSIGDLVFYTKNGKTFVRPKGKANNPRTPAQQAGRKAFAEAVELWKKLPKRCRQSWVEYARTKKHTGYNAFISKNSKLIRRGKPPVLKKTKFL